MSVCGIPAFAGRTCRIPTRQYSVDGQAQDVGTRITVEAFDTSPPLPYDEIEMFPSTRVNELTDLIVESIHPDKVILYGSRARGDATERSDFDFAIEGSMGSNAWNRLYNVLENQYITLMPIDLVNLKEADPNLRDNILKEGIVVYDKHKQI